MATIGDLYHSKHQADGSHSVISLPQTVTVLDATRVMNSHGIGAVLVMEGLRPVGFSQNVTCCGGSWRRESVQRRPCSGR